MNVSKYIKREKAQNPMIHTDDFIEEFKNPARFSVMGASRPLDSEIAGARPFAIHKSEKIPLDDFAYDTHERIRAGEHPWDVYGSPLDLPIESKLLYNPKNLDDKDVFVARMQEQSGVANNFTQRLENIVTDKPLNEIKEEERKLQTNLRGLDAEYHSSLAKLKEGLSTHYDNIKKPEKFGAAYSKAAAKKGAEIEELKTVLKKERTHHRKRIVVEPAYAAEAAASASELPASSSALAPVTLHQTPKKRVKIVSPPPVSAAAVTKKAMSGDAASDGGDSSGEEGYKTPQKGTQQFNEMVGTLVDIGQILDKPGLSPEQLFGLRKLFKAANINLPPNTKTQAGFVKKFYDSLSHLEKMGVNVNKVKEQIGAETHRGRSKERSANKIRARSHTVSPDETRKLY